MLYAVIEQAPSCQEWCKRQVEDTDQHTHHRSAPNLLVANVQSVDVLGNGSAVLGCVRALSRGSRRGYYGLVEVSWLNAVVV